MVRIKKTSLFFKVMIAMIVLAAVFMQFSSPKAASLGGNLDVKSLSDEAKAEMFESSPEALAEALNNLEPSS